MATDIDINSIIDDEGRLCGPPLIAAFQAIKDWCAFFEAQYEQGNPDGALLANGTVKASNCLSYEDPVTCATPESIPSWAQVLNLFSCDKVTATTTSTGEITLPGLDPAAGKIFTQLMAPVPSGVVGLALDGANVIALNAMGSPQPGVEVCVQYFQWLG